MPRLATPTSWFRKLLSVDLYKIATGTFGDTTTTAPVVGDGSEATIGITATTNFTSGDPAFVIGDGGTELFKCGTPNVSMPVTYKPKLPQSTGARFVEAVKVSLGRPSEDGVQLSPSRGLTSVISAVDDFPIGYIEQPIEIAMGFSLYEYSGLNLQLMAGYADEETGTGTTADPYQYVLGKLNQTLQGAQVVRVNGLRNDGLYVQIDMLDVKVEATGSIDHNRKAPAVIPMSFKATKLITRQATAAFTF